MRRNMHIAFTLAFAFVFVCCKIAPNAVMEPSGDVMFRVKPAAPKNLSVPNLDIDNSGLTVSWENDDIVDGYFVFYQTGDDYIKGEQPNAVNLKGDETSYTFNNLDEAQRYVFYAKSYKVIAGEVVFSDSSEIKESATKPSLSMTTVMSKKNSATLHFATSERSSVLHVGKYIYEPIFEVYSDKEGLEFDDSDELEEPSESEDDPLEAEDALNPLSRNYFNTSFPNLDENDFHPMIAQVAEGRKLYKVLQTKKEIVTIPHLDPSEAVYITFDMYVESKGAVAAVDSAAPETTIENPADMYPQPVKSASFDDARKDAISVDFTPSPINNGILAEGEEEGERVMQVYSVERRKSGTEVWSALISEKENAGVITKGADGKCSFTDTDVQENTAYDYRIIPYYAARKEKAGVVSYTYYKCEDAFILSSAFSLQKASDSEAVIFNAAKEDPNYKVGLTIRLPYQSEDMVADICRINAKDQSSDPVATGLEFEKAENAEDGMILSYTHEFALTMEMDKKKNEYFYRVVTRKSSVDAASVSEGSVDAQIAYTDSVATTPSIDPIDFLAGAQFSSENENAARVEMALSLIDDSELTSRNLEPIDIKVSVKRGTSPLSLSLIHETDFAQIKNAGCKIEDRFEDIQNAEDVDGKCFYYQIAAVVEKADSPYDGQDCYLSSNAVRTLGSPSSAEATDGTSADEITITFSEVSKASGYEVRYRLASDANAEFVTAGEDEIKIDAENAVAHFTKDANTTRAGQKYEFRIYSKDSSGRLSRGYAECKGSLFGLYGFRVEATQDKYNDKIVVKWTNLPNATRYDVTVFSYDGGEKTIIVDGDRVKNNDMEAQSEYVLYAKDVKASMFPIDGYPLNHDFYFIVKPYISGTRINDELLAHVKGSWLKPPKNIQATKGIYGNQIKVTWDPVEGAKGYFIYKKESGLSAWTQLTYVTYASNGVFFDTSVSAGKIYDYTVSSVTDDPKESLTQSYFAVADDLGLNAGYLLSPPEMMILDEKEVGIYEIDIARPLLFTGLSLNIDGDKQEFSLKNDNEWNTPSKEGTTIKFKDNGNITITTKRPKIGDVVSGSKQIISVSSVYDGECSPDLSISWSVKTYLPIEIVTLLHNALQKIVKPIDDKFEGDWWGKKAGTGKRDPYSTSTIYAQNEFSKDIGFTSTSRVGSGYIKLMNYIDPETKVKINSIENIIAGPDDQGLVAYTGTDPLEYLGFCKGDNKDKSGIHSDDKAGGEVSIDMGDEYGIATVTFNKVKVDGTSGSYTVVYNGKTTTVNVTDLDSDRRVILSKEES